MGKAITKIFMALVLLVGGVLWLVSELGGGFRFGFQTFCGVILLGIAVDFALGAVSYRSPGYLYFFGVFVTLGIMTLLDDYGKHQVPQLTGLMFRRLWMLLIAAPGFGSLIMFFVRKFSALHAKTAILLLGVAALIYLGLSGAVTWGIMIPCIFILLGLIILANVIFRRGKSWDEADNEKEEK